MKCPKCGSEINEGSFFCSSCGMQIDKPQDNASNQSNGKKNTSRFNCYSNNFSFNNYFRVCGN